MTSAEVRTERALQEQVGRFPAGLVESERRALVWRALLRVADSADKESGARTPAAVSSSPEEWKCKPPEPDPT